MPLAAPWLARFGTIVLVVGLYVLIADRTTPFGASLVLVVGCLFWVAFLGINELSRGVREPVWDVEQRNDVPWSSLWPFIAMPIIAVTTLLMMRLLAAPHEWRPFP